MTGGELSAVVLFGIAVFGAMFGVWKYVEGRIVSAKAEAVARADAAHQLAAKARDEIAAQRLHTAEVYVTKQGMVEQTSQIMRAIEAVASRIDGLYERLDRWHDNK